MRKITVTTSASTNRAVIAVLYAHVSPATAREMADLLSRGEEGFQGYLAEVGEATPEEALGALTAT